MNLLILLQIRNIRFHQVYWYHLRTNYQLLFWQYYFLDLFFSLKSCLKVEVQLIHRCGLYTSLSGIMRSGFKPGFLYAQKCTYTDMYEGWSPIQASTFGPFLPLLLTYHCFHENCPCFDFPEKCLVNRTWKWKTGHQKQIFPQISCTPDF